MIRHIVLVAFDATVSNREKQAIFDDLRRLDTVIPGMTGFAAGPNSSPERLDRGFTHAFTIDFADRSARDAYLAHPDHQAAGGRLVQATRGGIDGILVLDLEC